MATAEEAVTARTPIGSDLKVGVDTLSYNQKIVFDLYVRLILPLDGYAFWVKASTLSESALINSMALNAAMLGQPQGVTPPSNFIAQGSLHYATDSRQTEVANYSANRMVFTSEVPIQDLNAIGPDLLYIATFDGPIPGSSRAPASTTAVRFAFSSRGSYYRQANLWHYIGYAVYPTMSTQVVDDPRTLATSQLIVSNSLPIWLAYNSFNPVWHVPVPRPLVTLFPSMLVPDNRKPPYVAVHISGTDTEGMQSMPTLGPRTSQYALAKERVGLTLYGCNNDVAQSMLYSMLQYSLDTELFGVTNIPIVLDDKEGQNELDTIAQKKRIVFEVSYNQAVVRDVARQLIESCVPTYIVGSEVITP